MQMTLDKLIAWANKWHMEYNIYKYGVKQIRKRNLKFQYQMKDGWIKSLDEERDLGAIISKGLKF